MSMNNNNNTNTNTNTNTKKRLSYDTINKIINEMIEFDDEYELNEIKEKIDEYFYNKKSHNEKNNFKSKIKMFMKYPEIQKLFDEDIYFNLKICRDNLAHDYIYDKESIMEIGSFLSIICQISGSKGEQDVTVTINDHEFLYADLEFSPSKSILKSIYYDTFNYHCNKNDDSYPDDNNDSDNSEHENENENETENETENKTENNDNKENNKIKLSIFHSFLTEIVQYIIDYTY